MKKTISVILIITMLMSVLCLNSFAGALSLVSAPSTANKGDTITVSVNVPSGLSGAKLVLEYDKTCFKLVSNSASLNPSFTTVINDKTVGKLIAVAVSTNEQSACTLFSVKFKVLKTGGKISVKATQAIDGADKDITESIPGAVLTIAEGTGAAAEETIPPQAQTEPANKVTKPAVGNKSEQKKKVEGITGSANAPAPDETLPADIMPNEPTTAEEEEHEINKNTNEKAIIIVVLATVLALAAAIVIALVIKKKKQEDEPDAAVQINKNIDKDK